MKEIKERKLSTVSCISAGDKRIGILFMGVAEGTLLKQII